MIVLFYTLEIVSEKNPNIFGNILIYLDASIISECCCVIHLYIYSLGDTRQSFFKLSLGEANTFFI